MLFLASFILGCGNSGSDTEPNSDQQGDKILIKASGLIETVILLEAVSNNQHDIDSDGNYEIELPFGQSIYKFEIISSNQQACSLSNDLDLVCDLAACTADYNPVCAKKPFAGVVCITEPCQTDRYLTYGNFCGALIDNAWIAIETECGGLEQQISFHQKPVYITNMALLDIYSDVFTIITVDIIDDTLTIEFEVSGGCGSHDFTLFADEVFLESDPVQLSNIIGYLANDDCDAIIRVEQEFDLLPIQEIFRRAYPDATGEQIVNLHELGLYRFTID